MHFVEVILTEQVMSPAKSLNGSFFMYFLVSFYLDFGLLANMNHCWVNGEQERGSLRHREQSGRDRCQTGKFYLF